MGDDEGQTSNDLSRNIISIFSKLQAKFLRYLLLSWETPADYGRPASTTRTIT